MIAAAAHWIWSLASPDLSALIGIGLIALGIAVAVLRKIGNWT